MTVTDETRREALESIQPRLTRLQRAVVRAFESRMLEEETADGIAKWLGISILSIRPRVTELLKAGLLEETGERRPNTSGRMAAVVRLARPKAQRTLFD